MNVSIFVQSWMILCQCWRFFKNNKDLLIFPLSSLMFLLLFFMLLMGGLFTDKSLVVMLQSHVGVAIVSAIGVYFLLAFLIVFFNAGLIACAVKRLQGQPASVGDGLRIAASRWWPLLQWTLLNTTVGLLIRKLENSHDVFENIIYGLFGFAWTISTYFIIPVMVFENLGVYSAMRRGYSLFGKGWRRTLYIFLIAQVIVFAMFALLSGVEQLFPQEKVIFTDLSIGLIVMLFLVGLTLGSAFNGIVNSALYLTFANNQEPIGFDPTLLKQAFVLKSRRR